MSPGPDEGPDPAWHAVPAGEVLNRLDTSEHGLDRDEAARRRHRVGSNELSPPTTSGWLAELGESLTEPLQLLLVAVAVLSALWGEVGEAIAIGAIVVVVAAIETVTEVRARRALDALRDLTRPTCRVVTDGGIRQVAGTDLVPGDVIVVDTGDHVPADARLLDAAAMRVDESAMTGEAVPVDKFPSEAAPDTPLAERVGMLFAGTVLVAGAGRAVVVATGPRTELGRLGTAVAEEKEPPTPLQQTLSRLARVILVAAIGISVTIPLVGWLRGQPVREMVLAGLALAFATIPEELPILVTILLAVGGRRLARQHVLLRRLRAGETVGEVTVVVADKTGTLTRNRLEVARIVGPPEQVLQAALATVAPDQRQPGAAIDPLHAAIVTAAHDRHVHHDTDQDVAAFPFDADRKLASRVQRHGGAGDAPYRVIAIGAPEAVLSRCVRDDRRDWDSTVRQLGDDGLRVLAVAHRRLDKIPATAQDAEQGLVLAGLLGFADPLREGVPEAVSALADAGIATIMVTGDLANTAAATAVRAGLPVGRVVQGGAALASTTEADLDAELVHGAVVARATPADKLRIVRTLQARGERVAVTGDGVNDAPALAAADVGIAMGQRGTDLARQAADLVVTDDAYPTIATAIAGGRTLAAQLRRAVAFYLGAKVAISVVIGLPLVLGLPSPLAPVHIIILELFMDLGASLAFIAEPSDPAAMERGPRDPARAFLDGSEVAAIASVAAALAVAVSVASLVAGRWLGADQVPTVTIATWLVAHTVVAWAMRARPRLPVHANPAFPGWTVAAVTAAVVLVTTPVGDAVGLVRADPLSWAMIAAGSITAVGLAAVLRRFLSLEPVPR